MFSVRLYKSIFTESGHIQTDDTKPEFWAVSIEVIRQRLMSSVCQAN